MMFHPQEPQQSFEVSCRAYAGHNATSQCRLFPCGRCQLCQEKHRIQARWKIHINSCGKRCNQMHSSSGIKCTILMGSGLPPEHYHRSDSSTMLNIAATTTAMSCQAAQKPHLWNDEVLFHQLVHLPHLSVLLPHLQATPDACAHMLRAYNLSLKR